MFFKLFSSIDFAGNEMMVEVFAGHDLGPEHTGRALWYVAVGAASADALSVNKVMGGLIFLKWNIPFMAADAKLGGRGCFNGINACASEDQ